MRKNLLQGKHLIVVRKSSRRTKKTFCSYGKISHYSEKKNPAHLVIARKRFWYEKISRCYEKPITLTQGNISTSVLIRKTSRYCKKKKKATNKTKPISMCNYDEKRISLETENCLIITRNASH